MKIPLSALVLIILSCSSSPIDNEKHVYAVGDIPLKNSIILDTSFTTCDSVVHYYYYNQNEGPDQPAKYRGGPKAIKRYIQNNHPYLDLQKESGMITIHFILNCKGQIDHFQIVENDLDFQPKTFPREVTNQIVAIHTGLKDWRPIYIGGDYHDCFMHTTYIIKDGKIAEVLP